MYIKESKVGKKKGSVDMNTTLSVYDHLYADEHDHLYAKNHSQQYANEHGKVSANANAEVYSWMQTEDNSHLKVLLYNVLVIYNTDKCD